CPRRRRLEDQTPYAAPARRLGGRAAASAAGAGAAWGKIVEAADTAEIRFGLLRSRIAGGRGRTGHRRCGLFGPRLIILVLDGRQLLDEGDDRPDFLVRHLYRAKARHAGHLDPVLAD